MTNKLKLFSPINGKCVDLSQVPDDTFSSKTLGDGVAFIYDGDTVYSPCEGTITLVAETKHAIGIKSQNGLELLLHAGIDTVNLDGNGLEALVEIGQTIKVGTELIKIDRELMKEKNINMITPMIFINGSDYNYEFKNISCDLKQGETIIVEYEKTQENSDVFMKSNPSYDTHDLKYMQLCDTIIQNIGGKDNVLSVTHCVTRLRFKLKDESKANTEVLRNTKGVLKIIQTGGQYQVVIGPNVDEVYKDLIKIGGFSTVDSSSKSDSKDIEKQNLFNRFLVLMTGIFQPILSILMASGMIKALLVLLTTVLGVLDSESGTYTILYSIGDALFYFFPVAIGWSSARKFGIKDIYGITLGAILVYPNLVALTSIDPLYLVFEGTIFESEVYTTFFNIPVIFPSTGYSGSVVPIILIVWIASLIFKFLSKTLPSMLRPFFTPFLTILVTAPLALLIIGPIAMFLQGLLAQIMQTIVSFNVGIAGLIIGTFWSILVMFGLHMPIIMMGNINIATYGYDILRPLFFTGSMASMAATLGVVIRCKTDEERSISIPAMLATFFGVNEPSLYGVLIPRKKLMWACFISAGIGSMIAGFSGSKMYSFGASGILGLPCFINPEGIDTGFIGLCIGTVVSFILALISGLLLATKKNEDAIKIEMDF